MIVHYTIEILPLSFTIGIDQPPVAVTNLNIMYSELKNAFEVTWDDMLNIDDIGLGYQIQYLFIALDTVIAMDTEMLSDVQTNLTGFEYDIPGGIFSRDGVSINVTVQACNSFSLGEPSTITLENMEGS